MSNSKSSITYSLANIEFIFESGVKIKIPSHRINEILQSQLIDKSLKNGIKFNPILKTEK